jgi:2-keto-myo-inositol isomerase
MIARSKISLNRIFLPTLGLEEFFKLSAGIGLHKIELRNDLAGIGIIAPYSPEQVKELSEKHNIKILTINALQKFNLGAVLPEILAELKELIRLSVAIDCEAIVLVPTNNVTDKRDSDVIMQETVAALKALGPLFEDNGIWGYVEPLGFEECSLRSKVSALRAIQESDISYTGLVHVSGVESHIPSNQYKDDHRILITDGDRLKNIEQLELLINLGYNGDISFEPFAKDVQEMEIEALKAAINQSIDLITI